MILKTGYIIHDLGLVPRIKGLSRDPHSGRDRWVVNPTNSNTVEERTVFHDGCYGQSAAMSYKAAIEFLYAHSERLYTGGMRRTLHERRDKKNKTGTVGVCLNITHRGNLDYYCVVATPLAEQPGMMIYAGNENTKDKYLAAALVLAKDHRDNAVHKYSKRRRVKLKDAMPWRIPGIM